MLQELCAAFLFLQVQLCLSSRVTGHDHATLEASEHKKAEGKLIETTSKGNLTAHDIAEMPRTQTLAQNIAKA
eukprot:symbB.v1.2.000857.t1/scaffold37.1/size397765/29